MNRNEFAGKVVLVTGAAGGLGSTLCGTFARYGATVFPVDLNAPGCEKFDVGSPAGVEAMVERAVSLHDRLDVLVLNAGLQHKAPIAALEPSDWDRLQDVMLKGPYLTMKAAWPQLKRHAGNVVMISSASAFVSDPLKAPYCAAKSGLLGLMRTAALEGGADGIRVNAVAPGWMETPMALSQVREAMERDGTSEEEVLADLLQRQPIKRFVSTEEVAAAVRFLAADSASGITGTCVNVDLGLLAG